MKKILFLFLSVLLILTSCNGTKEFDRKMSAAFQKAQELTLLSAYVCDKTSRTWYKAIYDDVDHEGNYVSDFNVAIYRLSNALEEDGTLEKIRVEKKELNDYAKGMADFPKDRKNAYDDFIDYVTDVNALADLAIEPEGNLNSYRSNTNDIANRIKKGQDAFQLKYGDILIDVETEQNDSDDDW